MSDPTRIGGARGPAGRTLSDLHDQLGTLNTTVVAQAAQLTALNTTATAQNAQLTTLNANIATLLTRITYLTGTAVPSVTAFGSAGLPGYLVPIFGTRSVSGSIDTSQLTQLATISSYLFTLVGMAAGQGGFSEANVWRDTSQALVSVRTLVQRLNDYIVGTGAVQPDRGEDFYAALLAANSLLGTINQIASTIDASAGDIYDQAVLSNGYLLNQLASIGLLSDAPVGQNMRNLLAAILVCVCETAANTDPNAGGGGGGENPAPANCGPANTPLRLADFRLMGQQTISAIVHDVYYIEVTFTPPLPIQVLTSGGGAGVEGVLAAYGSSYTLYTSYNFTGQDRPNIIAKSGYNVVLQPGTVADALPDFTSSGFTVTDDIGCIGWLPDETCALGPTDYECYFLWVCWPAGSTPSANIFLNVEDLGCAS